jgi:multidrug resistance efflux pump
MTQAELEERKKDIQSLRVRITRQDNDVKQLSIQHRSAQQNYERQVRLYTSSVACQQQYVMLLYFQESRSPWLSAT